MPSSEARTKGVMMHHDLLLGAWRRIAHGAGVATAVEPAMERHDDESQAEIEA
jgi:hypothetical protein